MPEFDISVSLCCLRVKSGKWAARFRRVLLYLPDQIDRNPDFIGDKAADIMAGAFVVDDQVDKRLGYITCIGNHYLGIACVLQGVLDFGWGHGFAFHNY